MVRGGGEPPTPAPTDHLVEDQSVTGLGSAHVKRLQEAYQLVALGCRGLCQTQGSLISLLLL